MAGAKHPRSFVDEENVSSCLQTMLKICGRLGTEVVDVARTVAELRTQAVRAFFLQAEESLTNTTVV